MSQSFKVSRENIRKVEDYLRAASHEREGDHLLLYVATLRSQTEQRRNGRVARLLRT